MCLRQGNALRSFPVYKIFAKEAFCENLPPARGEGGHTFFAWAKKVRKETRQGEGVSNSPSPWKPHPNDQEGLRPPLDSPAAWRSNWPDATVPEVQAAFFEKWAACGGPGGPGGPT